jgi:hypothetical protein
MKIEINVSDQRLSETYHQGLFGWVTRHWAEPVAHDHTRTLKWVHVRELETGKVYRVSDADIERAVRLMLQQTPMQFAAMLAERGDAVTGDVLVQFAALGELKYG